MTIGSEEEARAFVAERCDSAGMDRLQALIAALTSANRTQNLVSKASLGMAWRRHIADSAQLIDHVPRETASWLDLGSGAGFPGLVIAVMRPLSRVILVESRRLRIHWLEDMALSLGCQNCRVIGSDLRKIETFEAGVISARAFAPLDRLVALSARFSTTGTRWVLPKGRSARQEIDALPSRVRSMFHVEESMTDPEGGIVVGMGKPEIAE